MAVPEQAYEQYYCHSGPWAFVMPDGQPLQHEFSLAAETDPAVAAAELGLTAGEWYDMTAQINPIRRCSSKTTSTPSLPLLHRHRRHPHDQ